jgi:Xaa-Pro aminopeptidase
MADINRKRAGLLMREAGLDGLVLFQPEAFQYAVGAPAGVATMWGRAGAAIAFVPADEDQPIAAIASDHAAGGILRASPETELLTHRIWIDMVDVTDVRHAAGIDEAYRRSGMSGPRPETFDRSEALALLADLLAGRGMADARLGADLEFLPATDFEALQAAIPGIVWADGSEVLRRTRAVKTRPEIERLKRAGRAAEAGLVAMADVIAPGASLSTLSSAWKAGAQAYAEDSGFSLSGHWDYISVGADLSDMAAVVTPGALIKADVGTLVGGYSSDGARTFSHGRPSDLALDLFMALEEAFVAGMEALRPGNRFCDVHAAAITAMRRAGFHEYARGHFGHSVGGSVGIEEWPFFSATNREEILPGMVVALETPFYGQGLGALMIEDMFLITETGADCLNTLPRGLIDLSQR